MDILLLGSNYFERALVALGHKAVWLDAGPDPHLPDLPARLDFKPQAIVLTDDLGQRVLPSGLAETDIPTVWYGVDSPINFYWQRHYAALFDLVLIDQKGPAGRLASTRPGRVHWLPVGVDTAVYQGPIEEKVHDLAFVGVVNDRVRPKRSRIIERLARQWDVATAGGRREGWVSPAEAGRLYRRSRLVLNENLFPGVTTRMFEAAAAGSLLLTEECGEGLDEVFEPNKDVAVFGPENLMERVEYYLSHTALRERMAERAKEKVLAGHDLRHRAERLVDLIGRMPAHAEADSLGTRSREHGKALFLTGLRWPRHNGLARLKRAERLLVRSESLGAADAETFLYLGLLSKMKRHEAGAKARLGLAAEAGSARADLALGFMHLEASRTGDASRHFQRASANSNLPFPPTFPPTGGLSADQHLALARILEQRGHAACPGFSRTKLDPGLWTGLENYQAALAIDPNHIKAAAGLGELLCRLGAFAEAHDFLNRAASLSPRDERLAERAEYAALKGYFAECPNREAA